MINPFSGDELNPFSTIGPLEFAKKAGLLPESSPSKSEGLKIISVDYLPTSNCSLFKIEIAGKVSSFVVSTQTFNNHGSAIALASLLNEALDKVITEHQEEEKKKVPEEKFFYHNQKEPKIYPWNGKKGFGYDSI